MCDFRAISFYFALLNDAEGLTKWHPVVWTSILPTPDQFQYIHTVLVLVLGRMKYESAHQQNPCAYLNISWCTVNKGQR